MRKSKLPGVKEFIQSYPVRTLDSSPGASPLSQSSHPCSQKRGQTPERTGAGVNQNQDLETLDPHRRRPRHRANCPEGPCLAPSAGKPSLHPDPGSPGRLESQVQGHISIMSVDTNRDLMPETGGLGGEEEKEVGRPRSPYLGSLNVFQIKGEGHPRLLQEGLFSRTPACSLPPDRKEGESQE